MPDLPVTSPADALGPAIQSYEEFLEDIKGRIRSAQARAARAINTELIEVYRQIGLEILRRQQEEGPELGRRTRGVVQRLSADLRAAFPGAKGYSVPNLYRMRAFAAAWPDPEGLSDRVRDFPWGHVALLVAETDAEVRAEPMGSPWCRPCCWGRRAQVSQLRTRSSVTDAPAPSSSSPNRLEITCVEQWARISSWPARESSRQSSSSR
jgi:hypothetical protein